LNIIHYIDIGYKYIIVGISISNNQSKFDEWSYFLFHSVLLYYIYVKACDSCSSESNGARPWFESNNKINQKSKLGVFYLLII